MSAALLVFNLVQITAEEPAVEILTLTLTNVSSREGLDQGEDLEFMLDNLAASPNGSVRPVKDLDIVVWEKDVEGMSPPEARLWFFRQWAQSLYRQGPEGLDELVSDPGMRAGLGPLAWINAQTHQRLTRVFQAAGALSLALMGLLLVFSHHFGRLGAPGCVILVSSLPGVLLFSTLSTSLGKVTSTASSGGAGGLSAALASLAANALPVAVPILLHNYMIFMAIGLGFMLLATLGHLISDPQQGD